MRSRPGAWSRCSGERTRCGTKRVGSSPEPAPSQATPWTAEQRYRRLVATTAEGIWRFELDPPVPLDLPEDELALAIFKCGRLAECNRAHARHYGFEEPCSPGVPTPRGS